MLEKIISTNACTCYRQELALSQSLVTNNFVIFCHYALIFLCFKSVIKKKKCICWLARLCIKFYYLLSYCSTCWKLKNFCLESLSMLLAKKVEWRLCNSGNWMSGHSYLQTVLTSGCSKKMHLPGSQILFASVFCSWCCLWY